MEPKSVYRSVRLACAGALLIAAPATSVAGQVTSRVSGDTGSPQANGNSTFPSISADGRFVAFTSGASNLVSGDTNGKYDTFVRDRQTGATERVSVDSSGAQGNGQSGYFGLSISADVRYVAFTSNASNLVSGDTNGSFDVFVRDRQTGLTERVSVATGGMQGNGACYYPSISADGRCVAFASGASNLVSGDTNASFDVFVHDRLTGATERVSVDSGGVEADGESTTPSISADGRYVAFMSYATNLVHSDTNGVPDVFLRDRQTGATERVSIATDGTEGDGPCYSPAISADGRYVAFHGAATKLVGGDTNGVVDVFVRDRQTGTTERVSLDSGGGEGNGDSYVHWISADGRFVAFVSYASNLVSGDTNGFVDAFVHDRQNHATDLVSVSTSGAQANSDSFLPAISDDGRIATFYGTSSNLVAGDTNFAYDVFVRDRDYSALTSLCDPGAGGVIACPCSNPPSGLGRGCDNSAGTGGAILSAAGVAYLSADSLVFTTSGEKPTATSVVLQGNALAASGVVYGQGVRCAGGALKRLFTKAASGGSITAPDFGAGDPTVSARSAAKGDVIPAGQSRWYLVFYRDPLVVGGCSATSTFNATQTGEATWWP
jgi:Tol biopolymer transport system component